MILKTGDAHALLAHRFVGNSYVFETKKSTVVIGMQF